MEPDLKPPRSPTALAEAWWNPRGTLPQTIPDHAHAEPGGTLVEPLWNLTQPLQNRGTLPQTTPDHPEALAEPGGTLVECSWNLASNHPRPPRSPRRTWWNPGETLVKPSWNITPNHPGPSAALAEPGGSLVEPYLKPPRTTPQPL